MKKIIEVDHLPGERVLMKRSSFQTGYIHQVFIDQECNCTYGVRWWLHGGMHQGIFLGCDLLDIVDDDTDDDSIEQSAVTSGIG